MVHKFLIVATIGVAFLCMCYSQNLTSQDESEENDGDLPCLECDCPFASSGELGPGICVNGTCLPCPDMETRTNRSQENDESDLSTIKCLDEEEVTGFCPFDSSACLRHCCLNGHSGGNCTGMLGYGLSQCICEIAMDLDD